MSDIQELIHKTSMDCIEKGQAMERERIIKELEANEHIWRERVVLVALKALIKGETNE
jgi:hypothetical protein